jgi:sugar phosphate permease
MNTIDPEVTEQLRIEQIRSDIARKTQEMLFEPRKYRLQFAAVIISVFVAGGIIGAVLVGYLDAHRPPPQPIIIQVPK